MKPRAGVGSPLLWPWPCARHWRRREMFARLRSLVRALTARRAFEAGLTEELRFHIAQYTEDLVRSGVSPEEARRRARMELGGINTVKEECREARGLGGVDALERE